MGTEGPILLVGPESLRSGKPQSGNPNPGDVKLKFARLRVASISSAVSFMDSVLEEAFSRPRGSISSRWYVHCELALLLAFGFAGPLGQVQELCRATNLAQEGRMLSHRVFALIHASRERSRIFRIEPLLSRQ